MNLQQSFILLIFFPIYFIKCNIMKNPEEGIYMEGDIMIPPSLDAVSMKMHKWDDGIVPYKFEKDYPETGMRRVKRAIEEFKKYTCVKFREATNLDKDYIYIEDVPHCASYVGKMGGRQAVKLSVEKCTWRFGTIIHELMHVLGIFHEQSRKDRSKHINILWQNIVDDWYTQSNFLLVNGNVDSYNLPYNPASVMHYSLNAFAKNSKLKTIELIDKSINSSVVGQRKNFSRLDLIKINRLYNCTKPDGIDLELNIEAA